MSSVAVTSDPTSSPLPPNTEGREDVTGPATPEAEPAPTPENPDLDFSSAGENHSASASSATTSPPGEDAQTDPAQEALVEAGLSSGEAQDAVQRERRTEALRTLPTEMFDWLVRSTSPRTLWKWLSVPERAELLHNTTRGFQRTYGALRQNAVRKRLVGHFSNTPEDASALLDLWTEDEPSTLRALRELGDEATRRATLPSLVRHHGGEAVLAALLACGDSSEATRDAWEEAVERAATDGDIADVTASVSEQGAPENADEAALIKELRQHVIAATKAREQSDAARLKAESEIAALKTALAALETSLSTAKKGALKDAQKAAQDLKQEQKKGEVAAVTLNTQLAETRRHAERDGRRLKVAEREREEFSVENKRLKRQLRQSQTAQEELRRLTATWEEKVGMLQAELEEAHRVKERRNKWKSPKLSQFPPATGKGKKGAPVVPVLPVIAPIDIVLSWNADGRPFRVSPREIKAAVDSNDEKFVNRLIQALDPLRVDDDAKYTTLMKRLREIDRYYARVLTESMTRVLIDASNVARQEKDNRGKGQLRSLLAVRDELRRRDCFPISIYADASLAYHIDDPEAFNAMVKRGEVLVAVPGQEADELLAREARRTGAYVVTNDRNFYLKVSPDYEPPRITFRIHDGFLVVDEF